MKSSRKNEPTAYCEIGSYLLNDNGSGRSRVKAYTSVNSPLQVDSADEIKQLGKVRVEMRVVESKDLNNNCFYEKDVSLHQISNAPISETAGVQGSEQNYGQPTEQSSNDLTVPKVLKNMIDNLYADKRLMWAVIIALAIIATGALVLSLVN